jgi:hypothetical protein
MAEAASNSIPDPSDLVRVEDMFVRMRACVAHRQSIVETMNDMEGRFRRGVWRICEREVDSNGEEIPGTLKPVVSDWSGTSPRLQIAGTVEAPYLKVLDPRDRRVEFFGLARDIKDWESRHPPPVPTASAQRLENKTDPDLPKIGAAGKKPRSRTQQILRKAADEAFPNGWAHLPTSTIRAEASKHRDVKALKSGTSPDSWQRALGRRED